MIENHVAANKPAKAQKGGDDRGNSNAILEIKVFLARGVSLYDSTLTHIQMEGRDVYV
jgi:hypothetical protein